MSYPMFPTLPGLEFPVKRAPKAASLRQKAISGRETFQPLWSAPLYDYEVSFALLRAGALFLEWQLLEDFWKSVMFAPGGVFQFTDPNDGSVTSELIATGDGTTTAFQLLRALAGFAEPVLAPLAVDLFKEDWQGNQMQYPTARTNLLLSAQDMTNAAWTKTSATATGAAGTAPDGTATAVSIGDTSATALGEATETVTVAADTSIYTVSVWIAHGSAGMAEIHAQLTGGSAVTCGIVVDPATGNWTSSADPLASAPLVASYPGGWWRVAFQIENSGLNTSLELRMRPAYAAALATPVNAITTATAADNTQTGTQLFWGAQIEKSPVATSYVATTSAAVTVTDYTLEPGGVVQFAAAPASGDAISWSGSYAWLCRFAEDTLSFENFMAQIFGLKQCKFETVRP